MNQTHKIYVFTDLDGSFLDHNTYDYTPALSALRRLEALDIPVIPTTSKTLAEVKALNLPFTSVKAITENGMVIFDGKHEHATSKPYAEILAFLKNLPLDIRGNFTGFGDMNIDEVIQHTGLPQENAELAKQRSGSEPFLWTGSGEGMESFKTLAKEQGLMIAQGGRFYHLLGQSGGKLQAIKTLTKNPEELTIIALGDGPNDADMLGFADYGIKIPNNHGQDFPINSIRGEIINAPAEGPAGWGLAIHALMDELNL